MINGYEKEKTMIKRKTILFVLIIAMVLTVLPLSTSPQMVRADGGAYAYLNFPSGEDNGQIDIYNDPSNERVMVSNGGIIISSGSAMAGVIINDELTNSPIVIKGNGTDGVVNVILDEVNLATSASDLAPVSLENEVSVNMKIKGEKNYITARGHTSKHLYPPAIKVTSLNAITFSGFNGEMGVLKAKSKNNGLYDFGSAVIGGSCLKRADPERDSGSITITDGASISAIVEMPSGSSSAKGGSGIGAGDSGKCSNIKITGGYVHATSYANNGIGGIDANIKISGGTVIAEGNPEYDPGIGASGGGSKIEITGGKVIAKGEIGIGSYSKTDISISGGNVTASGRSGAGIGSYFTTEGKGINISGGTVFATSQNGACIGSGSNGTSTAVRISGGFITTKATSSTNQYQAGIGCGAAGVRNNIPSDIFITGGSIVVNNSNYPVYSTPKGFDSGVPLNKVDIPFGNGIKPGNQELAIEIQGTLHVYKAKTVKSGSANEHGTDYTSAATVYLPEGVHDLKVAGKTYGNITVNSSGEAIVTRTVFDAPESENSSNTGGVSKKAPNVTKIYSPNKNMYLKKCKSIILPVIASATDSQSPKLIWSTSNNKVVSVNQSGKVTAKKKGKANVTVKAENGKSFTFTINVVTKDKKVKKISVSGYKKSMKKGQTKYLKVTLNPKTATNGKVTFSSSKKSVVTVDKGGMITANKTGKAKITIKAGGKKKVISIKVTK